VSEHDVGVSFAVHAEHTGRRGVIVMTLLDENEGHGASIGVRGPVLEVLTRAIAPQEQIQGQRSNELTKGHTRRAMSRQ
jgi:hypothetical protein